jgi:hypothetical protein
MSPKLLGLFSTCAEKGRILENSTLLAAVKRS